LGEEKPFLHSLGQKETSDNTRRMSADGVPAQPVDATQVLNLSAGVSNCKVSRGRSFTPAARPRPALVEPSASSQIAAIDPLQLIRSLVAESMQTYALSNQAAPPWQPQAAVAPEIVAAAPAAGPIMSAARDLYLAPPDRKKAHLSKGRSETAAIVQFAIDLLNDPVLHSVSKDDWDKLDLALPDNAVCNAPLDGGLA
jgi:hypothetical protein